MRRRLVAGLGLFLLAACRSEGPTATGTPTSTTTATPTSTSTTTATPTPTPTSTATPAPTATPTGPTASRLPAPVEAPPVPIQEAVALVPGGTTALAPGAVTTVDPASTFRVILQGTFPDARLSLIDPGDAMLPSAGAREVGSTTTLTLQPTAPLRPATTYRLRVDGASTREVRAKDGTLRAPVELLVLAAGEPPEEPKRRVKKPRR